jgi:PhnB protein
MTAVAVPEGSNTANPFVIADRAQELIEFLIAVLGAEDVPKVGDSLLTIADRKPDWPFTPAFTRVYVDDVDAVLARAEANGGRIVTRATEFFGDVLGRFQDPAGNLWWMYRHQSEAAYDWSVEGASDDGADESADGAGTDGWERLSTPELDYIHSTLIDAMRTLRDPRAS